MNDETTIPPLRTTSVKTDAPVLLKKTFNPTRIFVDKDRTAFFWFGIAVVSILITVAQPWYLTRKFKQREHVVIIDPAGTTYISPLLDFQEAKELHAQQSTLAAMALLERNPNGFDNPELLKKMFLKDACDKAFKQLAVDSQEFKSKQLHQKAEISRIDVLATRNDFVMTQINGQLIRTGIFQQKSFSEAIPFQLSFKMRRNPDMSRNGRFPTAVHDFKYEPSH